MTRSAQMELTDTAAMVEESIAMLRMWEPVRGYFLAFSGGKDSITVKTLADMAGVKYQAFYSMTTIDPPEVMRFIKQHHPDVEWMKPANSFFNYVREKRPPMIMQRWCCDVLKETPGMAIKKQFPIHLTGIRAEESAKRAKRPVVDMHPRLKGTVNIKPIFHWKEVHVWDFIESNGLPYPALYDEGFDRIGCIVCPMMFHKTQGKLNQHRNRWPGHYRAMDKAVIDWWNSKTEKDNQHETAEEYLSAYYRGFEI